MDSFMLPHSTSAPAKHQYKTCHKFSNNINLTKIGFESDVQSVSMHRLQSLLCILVI